MVLDKILLQLFLNSCEEVQENLVPHIPTAAERSWMEQGTGSYKCGENDDIQGKRTIFFKFKAHLQGHQLQPFLDLRHYRRIQH
jgi:hypothetical protein